MLGDPSLCPPSWSSLSPPPGPCSPHAQQLHLEVPEPRPFLPPGLCLCSAFARNSSSPASLPWGQE